MPAASRPPSSARTLSQALCQKIRELLQARRWSQREFARQLGVTQGAVSYLLAEKRRASVLDYYERLAQVFGVSLSVLIADLEQRVSPGGSPGTLAQEIFVSAATAASARSREEPVVLRAVFQALLDAHIDVARARIDIRTRRPRSPKPPRPRKRRPAASKVRVDVFDEPTSPRGPARVDEGTGRPAPAGNGETVAADGLPEPRTRPQERRDHAGRGLALAGTL